MPNKDGKGPDGEGPKTGRQRGDCEEESLTSEKDKGRRPCGKRMGRRRGN